TDRNNVKRIMSSVRSRVLEGHTLASSMEAFPSAFPKLYVATVDAGEESGHLDAVLDRLADYTESRQEMHQKVSTAMYYPVVLIVMAIGIVSGLLGFVVPKVVKVFQDMDQELPPLTKAVLWLSDFIVNNGVYMLIVMAIIYFLIQRLLKIKKWQYRHHRPRVWVAVLIWTPCLFYGGGW
ncbi:MAG TPA: type II secretion system protein GspF, partial [Nitrospirales bacterium]|nr:type II secretion system protein GspF [Nitrospirales bacterium]